MACNRLAFSSPSFSITSPRRKKRCRLVGNPHGALITLRVRQCCALTQFVTTRHVLLLEPNFKKDSRPMSFNPVIGVYLLAFVAIGGFFAAAEMAMISLREGQIRALARRGARLSALTAWKNLIRGKFVRDQFRPVGADHEHVLDVPVIDMRLHGDHHPFLQPPRIVA